MTRSVGWGRRLALFVVAVLLAAAWGSVVQTQFNLQALVALEVDVPMQVRTTTTLQDLAGFGPLYAGIVLAGWLPAFLVAALPVRMWPQWRVPLYAVAAGVGVIAAIRTVDAFAPMPVLIDATRGDAGLLAMAAGSVLAGAGFAWWTRPRRRRF